MSASCLWQLWCTYRTGCVVHHSSSHDSEPDHFLLQSYECSGMWYNKNTEKNELPDRTSLSGSVVLHPLTAFITSSSVICCIHKLQFKGIISLHESFVPLRAANKKYYSMMNSDLRLVIWGNGFGLLNAFCVGQNSGGWFVPGLSILTVPKQKERGVRNSDPRFSVTHRQLKHRVVATGAIW